jgi:hypothetical protein
MGVFGRAASRLIRKSEREAGACLTRHIARQVFPVWAAQGPFASGAASAAAMRNAYLVVMGEKEAEEAAEAIAKHAAAYDSNPVKWEEIRREAAGVAGSETIGFLTRATALGATDLPGRNFLEATGDHERRDLPAPLPSEEA